MFDQRGELPLLPFGYPIGLVPASRGGVYIKYPLRNVKNSLKRAQKGSKKGQLRATNATTQTEQERFLPCRLNPGLVNIIGGLNEGL